jgi:tRNA nucleotidyltransferase (CCA-adding enzyme)
MPDYIYLLENRLSADQRHALAQLREAAREAGTLLFLTGGPVRNLTSGHAVRQIEVAIHGNALKLKKALEKRGGKLWGEDESSRSLYFCFPGTVRVDILSAHNVEYPKPGKPVYHFATIQEDLRRRDFTVNAMAISLNEGSFGLLMDPLNGAADIESRTLRLVSNYGFLEAPELLIRAIRYRARLGWEFDPRTQMRYENARNEGVIEFLSDGARSDELEQIGHEEDGLKVLEALHSEGWLQVLFPAWTPAKADQEKLKALHELAVQLLMQGVHADMSAAQMQLLTAGLSSKDLSALKKMMLRPGFVEEWNGLDASAAELAKILLAKKNATPSASYQIFTTHDPEAVLWLGFTSKNQAVLERYEQFLKLWPEARQRIPYALMQEMRITPEVPNYSELVRAIFLELIDGKLTTPEEMRAYLEPHSPPAPPPQVTIKRTRAKRGAEPRIKEPEFEEAEEAEDLIEGDEDLDEIESEEEEADFPIPKGDLEIDEVEEEEEDAGEEEEAEEAKVAAATAAKSKERAPAKVKAAKPEPQPSAPAPAKAAKPVQAGKAQAQNELTPPHPKTAPKSASKPEPAKPKANPQAKKAAPAPAKAAHPGAKAAQAAKAGKPVSHAKTGNGAKKAAQKPSLKAAPAKHKPAGANKGKAAKPQKPAQKKPAAKGAKKR